MALGLGHFEILVDRRHWSKAVNTWLDEPDESVHLTDKNRAYVDSWAPFTNLSEKYSERTRIAQLLPVHIAFYPSIVQSIQLGGGSIFLSRSFIGFPFIGQSP